MATLDVVFRAVVLGLQPRPQLNPRLNPNTETDSLPRTVRTGFADAILANDEPEPHNPALCRVRS